MRRFSLFALLVALPLLGATCRRTSVTLPPVTLKFWGVLDEKDAYQTAIDTFIKLHPNVSIEYRKFRVEEFDRELLDALAEDRGPDVLMVQAPRVREYQTKLLPLPPSLSLAFQFVQGTIKKELVTEVRSVPSLTVAQFERLFVDQAREDAVLDGKIYGVPLAVDTLALFYNKELLNTAGIAEPPRLWSPDFQQAVNKLTKRSAQGAFIQHGAVIGTSRNVPYAADLLAVLLMQNGTPMTDERGRAIFDRSDKAEEALAFYTDFANSGKEVYTWNASQPAGLEVFASGKAAMMFGYASDLPIIRNRAPKLKLGIAPLPQVFPEAAVNFPDYWVYAVARKSRHPNEAWGFVQTLIEPESAKSYLAATKRPTAIRALIGTQKDDLDLGAFSTQTLTAKHWYKGVDVAAARRALLELIDAVVARTQEPDDALRTAVGKINQTVR